MHTSTYEFIEQEVLALTYDIMFADSQLAVYSPHVADLILRITTEIESIAREEYRRQGGSRNNPKFDYDYIDVLPDREKQCALIITNKMHFSAPKHQIIFPLRKTAHKKDSSGNVTDIYPRNLAYQSLKHDKTANLKNYGTVEYLLYSLAALYILLAKYFTYTQTLSSSKIFTIIDANGTYWRPIQSRKISATISDPKQLNFLRHINPSLFHAAQNNGNAATS